MILDRQVNTYEKLFEIAEKAMAAGVDIMQLRDKNGLAREILDFSKKILTLTKNQIPYIVNDRIDLAILSGAAGVHLGQDDVPLVQARKMLGSKALIGISCQTLAHALKAQDEGADYIGFGSAFTTLTKPDREAMDLDLLEEALQRIRIPVFAIGGINLRNLSKLKAIGARRIAVCRSICLAKDVRSRVERFKLALSP